MIQGFNIKTIDDIDIRDKRVLVRVDYNVTLNQNKRIADDLRIRQSLPTLHYLLERNNKIILIAHLGQPKEKDLNFSLRPIVIELKKLLKTVQVSLVDDFQSENSRLFFDQQKKGEIIILENIRFYSEEKKNDIDFAKKLAGLADIYVNDAFGVSHRKDASIVSIPQFIPSYAGLLLKREIETLSTIFRNPKKPFVAIIGGAKISTKINFLVSLLNKVDALLLGGALANTFLYAMGKQVGMSLFEKDEVAKAKEIIEYAQSHNVTLEIPIDVITQKKSEPQVVVTKGIDEITEDESIVDIGSQTQVVFGKIIATAKTILWNGPVGYIEDSRFARGTDFLYYSIAHNKDAYSIVGGGDTIASIAEQNYISDITWVSTGGGAMIEFVEKGTLPGLQALRE